LRALRSCVVHLSSHVVSQLTVGPRDEADVASASDRYALRFAGEVGRFLLEVQTRIVLELLEPSRGASVPDVGGGHAPPAAPLAEAGFDVRVLWSNPVACSRPRRLLGERAPVLVGDLRGPPARPGSFAAAPSFRRLPHTRDWR